MGPDGGGDALVAGGVGVDAVGEVEGGVAADAVEEVGDEGGVVGGGDGGEEGVKFSGVATHVGGHAHAEEHEGGVGVAGFDAVEDGAEVGAHRFEGKAAEAVVGAEGEDEDINGLAEDPVDAAESAGGGFAGKAGVDHAVGEAGGGDFFGDEAGVGLGAGVVEAVAGGQAVTVEEDGAGGGIGGAGGGTQEGGEQGGGEERKSKEYRHELRLGDGPIGWEVPNS